jgi:hypothetical protein
MDWQAGPVSRVGQRRAKWVSEEEIEKRKQEQRCRIVQETHDSILTGHPGRNSLYAILSRQFFWPQMSDHVRRFCWNCEKCGANYVWQDHQQVLLRLLPISERKWREISMYFVT